MKIFHYPLGHEAERFLTVAHLREQLAAYPDDMPVAAEWEGQTMPLGFRMQVKKYHCGKADEQCDVLVIDAEDS